MSNLIKEFFGFDPIADHFRSLNQFANCVYPKYNLVKNEDGSWHLEIAVAGFGKDDLSVEERNNTLIIEGKSKNDLRRYIHKGISTKPFKLLFPLSVDWKLRQVTLLEGILRFTFATQELDTTKKIEIAVESSPVAIEEKKQ